MHPNRYCHQLFLDVLDEVESIAASRSKSAQEPTDAIRVVNALLTQLDKFANNPNVLILTTSNLSASIDLAFVDRADLKIRIGKPGPRARYAILVSSIEELIRAGILSSSVSLLDISSLMRCIEHLSACDASMMVWKVAEECDGMSGRVLRKIPFLALMQRVKEPIPLLDYITLLGNAVLSSRNDMQLIGNYV